MVHVKIKFFTYINKSLNFIHIGKTIAASAIVFLLCGYFPIDFSLIALNWIKLNSCGERFLSIDIS